MVSLLNTKRLVTLFLKALANFFNRLNQKPVFFGRFCFVISLAFSFLSGLSIPPYLYPSIVQKKPVQVEYRLTAARQFQLFEKILAFERTWKARSGPELRIGILYEKSFAPSSWAKDDLVVAVPAGATVEGIPVRLIEYPLEERTNWEEAFRQEKILFLYVAPLSPKAVKSRLKEILTHCRQNKIATLTGETAYLESGVAVGLGLENNAPHVFINLQAAREQGLDFSSRLLRMTSIR